MLILFTIFGAGLIIMITHLFFLASKKNKWEIQLGASFECGFSSYFFSRFSFSMHYYLVGLIFLFLDLELCLLMPLFNENFSSFKLMIMSWIFVLILILGVLMEWGNGKLEWNY